MNTNTMINAKDIAGYEGKYAITDDGRVWSYKSDRFLKAGVDTKGYLHVHLCKDGKEKIKLIHRLVMETFNPVEGMDKLQVNHLDECKTNNNLSNLSWATAKENAQYSIHKRKGKKRGKIKPIEQYSLDGEFIAVYKNQAEASRQTGVKYWCIRDVVRGKHKTGGGFIWRYADERQ